MRQTLVILFQLSMLFTFSQNQSAKKPTYYCAPCGCELDDKIFDAPGKCPKCNMRLLEVGTFNYEAPSVSRDGILLYSSTKLNNKKQMFYAPLGSPDKSILIGEGGLAQFSPDGKKILFDRNDSIFTYSLTGRNFTYVGKSIQLPKAQTPCWSADGKGIFFAAGEFPLLGIYKLNLDSETIETIIETEGMRYAPAASPDGKKIAYRCRTGKAETDIKRGIAVYNLETKKENFITNIGEYCSWSPDGKQLAFHWPDSSDFCIYIVNADGSGLKKIAHNKGSDNELPTWSPDGKKIFFQTNRRRGNWEIWWMNVDGTRQESNTPPSPLKGEFSKTLSILITPLCEKLK